MGNAINWGKRTRAAGAGPGIHTITVPFTFEGEFSADVETKVRDAFRGVKAPVDECSPQRGAWTHHPTGRRVFFAYGRAAKGEWEYHVAKVVVTGSGVGELVVTGYTG